MQDVNSIWSKCLALLEESDSISELSYSTWIVNLEPVSIIKDTLILQVPSSLDQNFINTRYLVLIRNALKMVDPDIKDVRIIIKGEEPDLDEDSKEESFNYNQINGINPRYTFESFVIGENNRFAQAACVAVADGPTSSFNPLFIYGGVGLGKTHLMQAIGNYIIEEKINRKVTYVSCEDFTNEFIASIQNNRSQEFREKYRSSDILLIDDIQFLAGKVETQEAFFHTFNTLYESDKQIVISSDRPPKEIPKLEERLRSRFEMGLMTDISTPTFETRMAILLKKAEAYDLKFDESILSYIAENFQSNIRELEGALTKVAAYADLHQMDPTLEMAKESLKDLLNNQVKKIDVPFIKEVTAKYFSVTPEELDSKKRTKNITQPRQVAMYLSRLLTDLSFPKIGEQFGGRDHSTVVHNYNKVQEDIQNQEEYANLVEIIKNEILNSAQS